MNRKILHKTSWYIITAFFLMIAWATSDDDVVEVPPLPISAYADGKDLLIINEGPDDYDSLSMILNGIYSLNPFALDAQETARVPSSSFNTRDGIAFPESEAPDFLEIYFNGKINGPQGGYVQVKFE